MTIYFEFLAISNILHFTLHILFYQEETKSKYDKHTMSLLPIMVVVVVAVTLFPDISV